MPATTVKSLTFQKLNLPLTEPFAIATGAQLAADNVLIQVELENGIVGLGEAAPFPAVSGETQQTTLQALEKLKPLVKGSDAAAWGETALHLKRADAKSAAARCAIEMALLDAYTQHLKLPLHRYFGKAGETTLFTDFTITAQAGKGDAATAQALAAQGFSTIKIKTDGKDVLHDVARVQKIHEAAPAATLIVDGNCGYNLRSALQFLEKLQEKNLKLALLEQPLSRDDWFGMTELTRLSPVPICADESARTIEDVQRILVMRSADVVNIKLMKSGISEGLKMIKLAQKGGLKLMIGGMVESILAMTVSAHVAAGLGCFSFIDLDTPLFIASHPFSGGFLQNGPKITLPAETAGHGVKIRST